ncbi:hypothetical protein R1sor_018044 [Riccia sorocarpa]|uniref:Uncharacterized protein n=1 Tax=Riccia sorocarpa TaxID=122646 RepID=A0ABD3I8Q0_9MARC
METLKLAYSGEIALRRTLYSSPGIPGVRGLSLESFNKPLIRASDRLGNINKSVCSGQWSSMSRQRRGLQTLLSDQPSYQTPSRWDIVSSAGVMRNQAHFRRLTLIDRHLNSKPLTASRAISINASSGVPPEGPAQEDSFIVKLIEKVIQFIASLLPSKAVVQKVEEEIDTAVEVVKETLKVVVEVADEVEKISNIVEAKAEEVERIAQKVEQINEEVKKVADDIADVLEGQKGFSSLNATYADLKKHTSATEEAAVSDEVLETRNASGVAESSFTNPQMKTGN